MAITIQDNATKTAIANAVVTIIETAPTARILIRDASNNTLCTIQMNATGASRFPNSPTNGVVDTENISPVTASHSVNAGAATAATNFVLEAPNGTPILTGTVTATGGGGDLTMNNVNIANGDLVDPGVLTLRAPNS